MSVKGKRVVVMGASSGVGRGIATVMARQGALVVAAARRETLGREIEADAEAEGTALTFVRADISSSADCDRVIATAVERHGGIDVLVNSAGIEGEVTRLHELSDEHWQQVIDTNLTGAFYSARAALRQMITNGGGVIINIASINAAPGYAVAHMAPYNSSKAALVQFTNTIAVEYLFQGVRANTIILGGAEGETAYRMEEKFGRLREGDAYQRPPERSAFQKAMIQTAEQIGEVIALLSSDDARLLTGATIAIDKAITAGFFASMLLHGATRENPA